MAGLAVIATTMGPFFEFLKYAVACYLAWLGISAFVSAAKPVEVEARKGSVLWRDVSLGLLVKLGNPKPILFYSALMPTFLDMTRVGWSDYVLLSGIAVVISYAVYGGYMLAIEKARRVMISAQAIKRLNQATGTMFIGSGILVATR